MSWVKSSLWILALCVPLPLILHPIKIPSKPLLGENREFFEQRGEVTPTFSLAFIVCHSKKEYNVIFFLFLNGI